ncbi:MAG: hypothetical protein AABY47_04210 [Pseudomonadota bacterium]
MNEFKAEFLKVFSFDLLKNISWLDIASILAPTVVLIFVLFGISFFLRSRNWKITTYITCTILTLIFLPYELFRQATEISRAEANVSQVHQSLQELLNAEEYRHLSDLANKEVAAGLLDKLISGLDKTQKKDLILMSWVIAENEKNSLNEIDNKQKSLVDEIKSNLDETKTQIIDSRPPVEKISDDIVKRLDDDINRLVESKLQAFKQELDTSLDSFQQGINSFVQTELNSYGKKLSAITQQNVDELKNYSSKAEQAFAQQASKTNQESLKKLDDTKESIDGIGAAIENINMKEVIAQVKQLSNAVKLSQKKNDILFEYNECVRSAGLLDLAGKEDHCRNIRNQELSNLK